jgi:CRISPR-associated protein Csx17
MAVGLASCATLPGTDRARMPARTMRQILLPVDPPESVSQARTGGRWRDTPVVAGLGVRPLRDVLAGVLAWRSRTATDEPGQQEFRGVPTFRSGVPVPAADLHAFASRQLDEAELEFWLRACLALDWRGVQWRWPAGRSVLPVPTLGLLHPLALGLSPRGAGNDVRRLALSPDWAYRLAAGQVSAVHREAVARYRQAGWDAVPALETTGGGIVNGVCLAAALVPRCRNRDAEGLLGMLAVPLRDEQADDERLERSASLHDPTAGAVPGREPQATGAAK